jgi:hypothetical protein
MRKNKALMTDSDRLLASLSAETMDRLADLVAAKLKGFFASALSSKQVAAGPNPVSRSTTLTGLPAFLTGRSA